MRDGLDTPTFELPSANVDEIRAFLDGQSRIALAVWVRHAEGGTPDHHLMLAVDDDDWSTGDMAALEAGIGLPALDTREPTWIDLFPASEVERLRAFGTVVWEGTSPGGDPLDYRFTYDTFVPEPVALHRFVECIAAEPAIRCAGARVQKLWHGDELVEEHAGLFVDAPPPANVLQVAADAARETIFAGWGHTSTTLGRPGPGATILYEAAA
jgi:hypothetical protein